MGIDFSEFYNLQENVDGLLQYLANKSSENMSETITFLVNETQNNNLDLFKILNKADNQASAYKLANLLKELPASCILNFDTFHQYIINGDSVFNRASTSELIEKISFDSAKNNTFLELFEKDTFDTVDYFLSLLVFNNPDNSFDSKIEKAKSYINSDNEKHIIAGFRIIERCIQDKSFDKKDELIGWLLAYYNNSSGRKLEILVTAMCNLYPQENIFKDTIIEAKNKNEPQVNMIISTFLWRDNSHIQDREFFSKLLKSYENTNCEYMEIIHNLDFILMDLFDKDFELVFDFFTNWISKSDYGRQSKSLCKIWSSLFSHIKMSQKASFIYTSYLLEDEYEYHKAATDIIREISIFHKLSIELDSEIIKNCNIDDIVFICRKILGYIIDVDDICKLFDSILLIKFDDKQICSTIINAFITLADDYGYPVIKYFKQKDLSEESSKNTMYNYIVKTLEKLLESRKKIEHFPELEANLEQRTTIIRKQFEESKEIAKSTREDSVVMKIFKPVQILYGNGSCYSFNNSEETKAIPFAKFEQSVYFSNKDIYCPVDSEIKRVLFRIAKRGEK